MRSTLELPALFCQSISLCFPKASSLPRSMHLSLEQGRGRTTPRLRCAEEELQIRRIAIEVEAVCLWGSFPRLLLQSCRSVFGQFRPFAILERVSLLWG